MVRFSKILYHGTMSLRVDGMLWCESCYLRFQFITFGTIFYGEVFSAVVLIPVRVSSAYCDPSTTHYLHIWTTTANPPVGLITLHSPAVKHPCQLRCTSSLYNYDIISILLLDQLVLRESAKSSCASVQRNRGSFLCICVSRLCQ